MVHIAHENHTASKREELSVNKGDNIGIIDKSRDDGYWMVNYFMLVFTVFLCDN